MDLFVYVVSILVMIIGIQSGMYWLIILVAGIIVYLGKDIKTFIIVLGTISILSYLSMNGMQEYNIYIGIISIILFLMFDKQKQDESFNPNDQYADLLKGLGG